jgi:hydroxymethylglutaryl-CoA synthase
MKNKIGISEISVEIPEYFIGKEKIAKIQNLSLDYIEKGIGVKQSRISYKTSLEDLILKAIKKVNYKDAGRFIVASESDDDLSKASIAVRSINEKLKLTTVPFQLKFACLAGIQALLAACDYVASHHQPAIVIAADRSFYKEKKAGVTQGSGVVVLRIEQDPKLLEIDFQNYGEYGEDIDDFKIPVKTAPFPKISGELTKPAYLKCVLNSLRDLQNKIEKDKIIQNFDYFVLHSPFPKMVLWASAVLWRFENYDDKNTFYDLLERSIKQPSLFQEFKKLFDEVRKEKEFRLFFKNKVKQALKYNPYIGNSYTASIFISLISVLENAKKDERVCLVGYGSGAGSISLTAKVNKSFETDLQDQLDKGKEITLQEYQIWRGNIIKNIKK